MGKISHNSRTVRPRSRSSAIQMQNFRTALKTVGKKPKKKPRKGGKRK